MIEIEQTNNIKTDEWYKEYVKTFDRIIYANDSRLIGNNEPSLSERIEILREQDKEVIIYNHIANYLKPINEKWHEIDRKIQKLSKDPNYLNSEVYRRDIESRAKIITDYYAKVPIGVTKEQFDFYHSLIRGDCLDNSHILFEYNSIEKNRELIGILRKRINSLKENPDINKLAYYEPMGWKRCVLFTKLELDLCQKVVDQGFLVTGQLYYLDDAIDNHLYDDHCAQKGKFPLNILKMVFNDFECTNEQIFDIIRKKENWHHTERDITIYQEKQKGFTLQEIGDIYRIKFNAVSMVLKKVSGAINLYKGIEFENFVSKRLKESKLFKEVKKLAGKGEPDILAYTKDDKLYIYSVKNIEINRNPYWLIKDELRPELEFALLSTIDYEVYLILLVYNSVLKNVKQYWIDYQNPQNIDISK